MLELKATEDARGIRLDVFLSKAIPGVSRARLQDFIVNGHVLVDNKVVLAKSKLKGGEHIVIDMPEPKPSHLIAQEIPLEILYEDDDLVVINKPAGLVVHPGAGNSDGTLVNALLYRFPNMSVGDANRPGLVHRLDKETSGVMVVAKHDQAFQFLVNAFKRREIDKSYRAFCVGVFNEIQFELYTGHERHKSDRKRFTTKTAPGLRVAHSRFEVIQAAAGITELKVDLLTGRTHQIRAHLADINRPLVQDELYGGVKAVMRLKPSVVREVVKTLDRHALHSERIAFEHPRTGKRVVFEAPLPKDLLVLSQAMRRFKAE